MSFLIAAYTEGTSRPDLAVGQQNGLTFLEMLPNVAQVGVTWAIQAGFLVTGALGTVMLIRYFLTSSGH